MIPLEGELQWSCILGMILTKQMIKLSKREKQEKKKLLDYWLKKKLLDYCGEKKLILQTHTGIPDVIIQKKLASVSRTLPLVIFDKKVPFSKNSVILRYFGVKLREMCFFKDFERCPKILDYTLNI